MISISQLGQKLYHFFVRQLISENELFFFSQLWISVFEILVVMNQSKLSCILLSTGTTGSQKMFNSQVVKYEISLFFVIDVE